MTKPFFFQMAVKEVTDAADGSVRVRGYASTPQLDRYRDIVEPEAFAKAIEQYLKTGTMLRSHDADRPVGIIDVARVDAKGLYVEGNVVEAATAGDVKAGLFRTFSIGYIATKTEIRNEDNEPLGENDSMWDRGNIRVIKELDLVEISIVSTPANPGALFTLAKSLKQFTNQLAFKAFGMEAKDNVPDNEKPGAVAEEGTDDEGDEGEEEGGGDAVVTTTETTDEAKTTETTTETVAPVVTDAPVEEVKPDATADEVAKPEDEAKEVTEKPTEEAENAGEKPVADGGEGVAPTTEAPKADAKPEGEAVTTEEESESKELIVTKDIADLLPSLTTAGAIREAKDGEQSVVMTKATIALLKSLHDALGSENERANTEMKRANDLQAKLDAMPERKVLATHRQFAAEEDTASDQKAKGVSEYFAGLFKL